MGWQNKQAPTNWYRTKTWSEAGKGMVDWAGKFSKLQERCYADIWTIMVMGLYDDAPAVKVTGMGMIRGSWDEEDSNFVVHDLNGLILKYVQNMFVAMTIIAKDHLNRLFKLLYA